MEFDTNAPAAPKIRPERHAEGLAIGGRPPNGFGRRIKPVGRCGRSVSARSASEKSLVLSVAKLYPILCPPRT
jgi:hypothetical protein